MDKRFVTEALRLMHEYSEHDGYFYRCDAKHILCGFACERTPTGVYVWSYALPLYERFYFMHLGYGKRLPYPDEFIAAKGLNSKALAVKIVGVLQPHQPAIEALSDLSRFAAYVENDIGLSNYIVRKGYASTLIMLGRRDEALDQLSILKSLDESRRDQRRNPDIEVLFDNLRVDIEAAQSILKEWEHETSRVLGIKHA